MKTQIYKEHLITFCVGLYWTLGTGRKTLKAAKSLIDKEYE